MPMFLRSKGHPYQCMTLWHRVGFAMALAFLASIVIPAGVVLDAPALCVAGLALLIWVVVGT